MSIHDRISSALQILRDGRVSILDFLVTILDPPDAYYSTYRDRVYVPSAKEKKSGTEVRKSAEFSVGGFPKPSACPRVMWKSCCVDIMGLVNVNTLDSLDERSVWT